jgi:hypothetical protein
MQRSSLFCLSLLCIFAAPIQAQTQSPTLSAPAVTALAKPVHLSAEMTLIQAMKSLSEQIGVEVQIADYLTERRLTANLDHVTAQDALDALAELEDWQWREDKPGHIRVERRPTLVPKERAFIPRWIQAELPRDIRDYFHLPRPDDDPKKYTWANMDIHDTLSRDFGRAIRLHIEQQRLAIENHLPALHTGEKFYVAGLTLQEKQHLLLGLAVQAIYRTGSGFWKGDLPPYASDPSNAMIALKGNALWVGSEIELENGSTSTGIITKVK